ncbi:MAG: hypothetical protein ACXACP_14410, partial [Candidatus Hodarchaeales archaeon]
DIEGQTKPFGLVMFILSMLIGMGALMSFFFLPGTGIDASIFIIFSMILLIGVIPIAIMIFSLNQNHRARKSEVNQMKPYSFDQPSRLHWNSRTKSDVRSFCSNCGSKIGYKDLYCMECGTRLD